MIMSIKNGKDVVFGFYVTRSCFPPKNFNCLTKSCTDSKLPGFKNREDVV